jgi:HEAT repeat protein
MLPPPAVAFSGEAAEHPDDPGVRLYKAGYKQILDGLWDDARSTFRELLGQYPASEYVDDAEYWSAYATLKSNNAREAVQAYHNFLEKYRESTYYDDAVADFTEAQALLEMADWPGTPVAPHPPGLMEHRMRLHGVQLENLTPAPVGSPGEPAVDPETRIRLDALDALGTDQDNEKYFQALKDVILDPHNPVVLRRHALDVLAQFEPENTMPVLVQVAKSDTNMMIQAMAIDYISSASAPETVQGLIEVFHAIPPGRSDLVSRTFFLIADTGDDQAVDFLTGVAKSHENMSLRREAVYYLGAIGSEKARSALHGILRGK